MRSLLAALLLATTASAQEPYQRITEERDGAVVKLEIATREFAPSKPDQPRIFLVGAVHIGEPSFYRGLQEFLDARDVVLFEGVKPPGSGAAEHDVAGALTDADRQAATHRRIRFIAMAIERYRAEHKGRPPASLDALIEGSEARIGSLLKGALDDGWGHALVYALATPDADHKPAHPYDIVSLGADGQPGGEGPAADLKFSDQKPLSKPETGDRSEGIQQKLADATGWVFQLTAMDHNKPNWRNSDLSVDQVQARLEKAGLNADGLFSMLSGSSLFGRFAGFLIGVMGSTPDSRAMLRVMFIELIGRADLAAMKMPGKSAAMMDVLVEDRNAVVLEDLKRLLQTEPNLKTIAIIYGAGHLPTLEKRLVSDLGYTPAGDTWRPAMTVDAGKAGISPGQLKQVREMIKRMMDAQTRQKPATAS